MKQPQYTLQDMIHNKLETIEFGLQSIADFKNQVMKPDVSYDAPSLWSDSGFATWKEFRAHRKKYHITSKSAPIDTFPVAGFDMSDPGAIKIIEDDFQDLLDLLRRKNLRQIPAEYISSIFFAVEVTDGRLHYMLGSFNVRQTFDKKAREDDRKRQDFHRARTGKATAKKRNKRDENAKDILRKFYEEFKKQNNPAITRNGIYRKIRETRPEEDTWSINTIKNALERFEAEGVITLPPRKMCQNVNVVIKTSSKR